MNYFDKYIKFLNDDSKKAKQILFFMMFSDIRDYNGSDHYLISFDHLRYTLYSESVLNCLSPNPIFKDKDTHYILFDNELFTNLKLKRTEEYSIYLKGRPYNYVDVHWYFTTLNESEYRILVQDFMNWLNAIWKKAKTLEEKSEKVSPTSDQIQAIGTLFHTEFFQK